MKIAVGLPQISVDPDAVVRAARDAEQAGAWGVWVFDNLAPLVRPERPVLEGWMLLGALARSTKHVRLISLVTRAGLRHPALVVRMAAVIHAASGGRLVLGLGAGDRQSLAEERRFGVRAPARRSARIDDVRETIRRLDADSLPVRPRLDPPPDVWIGGLSGELVEVAARHAHAWHGWEVSAEGFAVRAARVRRSAGSDVECWWGGMFDPETAPRITEELRDRGCDGITWMLPSAHDARDRPVLLKIVAQSRMS